MALDPSPSLLPPAAPPIGVAARCLAVASEELEEDRGEKKEIGANREGYLLISTAQPSRHAMLVPSQLHGGQSTTAKKLHRGVMD